MTALAPFLGSTMRWALGLTFHEGVAEGVQQAERAGDVLDRLREFVRGGEFRRTLTEIKPLIGRTDDLAQAQSIPEAALRAYAEN